LAAFSTASDAISGFAFLAERLRGFGREFLLLCLAAVEADLFFFLAAMSGDHSTVCGPSVRFRCVMGIIAQIYFQIFLLFFNNSVKNSVENSKEQLKLCSKAACFDALHWRRCEC
jgi:hypothetical protein